MSDLLDKTMEPVDESDQEEYDGSRDHINVYEVVRVFGGHEEGGWWTNRAYPRASVYVGGQTEEFKEAMEASLRQCYGFLDQGNIYSVSGGSQLLVRFEKLVGELKPKERYC